MNQKQLANVLIKILGLSFGVEGVVRIFTGIISIFSEVASRGLPGLYLYLWTTPLGGLAIGVIGFVLIVLSRTIADILFGDE